MAYLGITLVLFVASLLSKAMATPLPFVYLLIDYYEGRRFTVASVLEKLPFLALAVWFGLIALGFQSQEAIAEFNVLTTYQRFVFAAHGFYMYWVKMLVPFNLSAFYPYPSLETNGNLPFLYYLAPFVAVAVVAGPLYLLRKNKPWFSLVAFSLGFYFLMIALVLQFVSVGQVMMAERYSYVPYIGSLFLLTSVLNHFMERGKRTLILGAAGVFSLVLIVLAYRQAGIWHNSETLWTRVIELYPFEFRQAGNVVTVTKTGAAVAYGSRALYYYDKGDYDRAFADLKVMENVGVKGLKFWQALGIIYGMKNEYERSLDCFTKALAESPGNPNLYYNRGISYSFSGDARRAMEDFDAALRNGVQGENRYQSLKGKALESMKLGDFTTCLETSEQAMREYPDGYDGYFYHGTALVNVKRSSDAVQYLLKGTELRPQEASCWYNLAVAYNDIGDKTKARQAVVRSQELGYNVPPAMLRAVGL